MERAPSWGIEPVPDRMKVLGLLDTMMLWGNLGISLLVIVAGAFLGPALGLKKALLAIVIGAVLGNALLALAGLIGERRRVPAMVLLRDPLGHRGSYVPTVLNVGQNIGWAIFELIVIATAASALSDRVFGFHAKWFWTLLFAGVTVAFAFLGPVSFVRQWVRRFALWVVLASLGYLMWWTLDGADLGALWHQAGDGSLTFAQGVDLTIAMAASWLPLAADYTRFSRDGRSAFWGTGIGYAIPNALLYMLGAVRQCLLLSCLAPEPLAARATAAADPRGRRGSDRGRAHHRPGAVPQLPLPARILLRSAVRGARSGLPARPAADGGGEGRRAHGVGRGLRPVPVAAADGPLVVD